MKFRAIPLSPAHNRYHPFVLSLVLQVVKQSHILFHNGPKAQVLRLAVWICWREAIKCFKWKGESSQSEKKSYTEVAKNESSICEIAGKEKEICANFAVTPQTVKVMATVHDNCLVKLKKGLNIYNKIFWERPSSQHFLIHCYNCSILLLVIVVNLLLCLT